MRVVWLGLSWVVAAGALTATAGAATDAAARVNPLQTSENWAGYVTTGDALTVEPISFSTVSARWVQPKAACGSKTSSGPTSSSFWVGLGGMGNSNFSNALEQTGTEADCTSTGARYFAWYELVPAPAVKVSLKVSPGDTMSASVSVSGKQVSILIRDVSQGVRYSKKLAMNVPDTSSAEWIAEAPSVCVSSDQCHQQSLTDFGTVKFSNATAHSESHSGSISDPTWSATPIELQAGNRFWAFVGRAGRLGPEQNDDEALPSSLSESGTAFSVTWHNLASAPSPSRSGSGGYFSL